MDPIEKAIRNAFEKGNADDRAFREKVYRSAFAALDRALQANPDTTVEVAIKRRKAMQARITEIESEFLPAVAAPAIPQADGRQEPVGAVPPVDAPSIDAPAKPGAAAPGQEPILRVDPPAFGAGDREKPGAPDFVPENRPPSADPGRAGVEVSPDRDARRARRRLPWRALLSGLVLLAVAGAGLWWAMNSGAFQMPDRSGSASSNDQGGAAGDSQATPAMPGQSGQDREWITVFSPGDPTLVSAPADAGAEVIKDDTGSFLRIRSGASGSAISFDVGQGILEQLSGQHAVFDVLARAEDGKDTQMSIDCNFGELGDCGRKRYVVGHERNEYLFDVQFPDQHPGAAGTIAINSDFDGKGRSVDIYEIRVSVAQ